MVITSFPQISSPTATTLILGSMPGKRSLDENQYYAHPRNAFWKIMAELFRFDIELSYQERCKKLIESNIALWDVMQNCERQGSLDSAIVEDTIVPNNFHQFLQDHPDIKLIGFNGRKAEHAFRRYVLPELGALNEIELISLPSTSPAYASLSFAGKLEAWQLALTS